MQIVKEVVTSKVPESAENYFYLDRGNILQHTKNKQTASEYGQKNVFGISTTYGEKDAHPAYGKDDFCHIDGINEEKGEIHVKVGEKYDWYKVNGNPQFVNAFNIYKALKDVIG